MVVKIRVLLSLFLIAVCTEDVYSFQTNSELIQNVHARDKISLDGFWDIIIDPLENGYYNYRWQPRNDGYFRDAQMKDPSDLIEYNFETDHKIMVPGDWNTQMEKLYYYEGTVWYRKVFDAPENDHDRHFVYFEAANYHSVVYLNGEKLGEHEGGFTPFQVEVTGKLQPKENKLIVKVDNSRYREAIPTVNTDWWNYGGITRSVHLVSVPETFIQDYFISLDVEDDSYISGWVKLSGSGDGSVRLSIPELEVETAVPVRSGMGSFTIKADPERWSPDHPKRYKVHLRHGKEMVEDEIGFRTIGVQGTDILLNGEKVFLKGISIHEEAPFKTGRVTSPEQNQILLEWAKELGANFVRLAHYPHNEMMVRQAEKMGLMVWSEIPVYWTVLFENEDTYMAAESQLTAMINRDRNRAGVILWSVANETPVGEARTMFLRKLVNKTRELDDSRLVTAALESVSGGDGSRMIEDPLGESIDVIGINTYCGWYGGTPESCRDLRWDSVYDKPVIISEFGAGALQGLHGEPDERWTEEYQDLVYDTNIEMLQNMEMLAGVSPWILMDFRSHRRHLRRIQKDFNRKGLISEQGVKKKAFYTLQDYYRSIEN